jgi:hypothetical protein
MISESFIFVNTLTKRFEFYVVIIYDCKGNFIEYKTNIPE